MKRRDLLIAVLFLILVWQVAALLVNRPILPTPLAVGQTFVEEIQGDLMEHFLASLWRVIASTALAIAAHNGLACAPLALFGTHEQKERFLTPLASGSCRLIPTRCISVSRDTVVRKRRTGWRSCAGL